MNAVAIPYYQEQVTELLDYSEVVYNTIFAGFLGSWPGRVDLIRALSQTRNVNCWSKGMEKYHHYSAFSLRLPEARIPEIGAFLADWFGKTPADTIARMCEAARQAWEEHLGPTAQERLVVNALHRIKNANYRLNVAQMADVELLRQMTRKSPK